MGADYVMKTYKLRTEGGRRLMKKRIMVLLLCVTMILPLAACGRKQIDDGQDTSANDAGKDVAAIDFAVRLFKEELKGETAAYPDVPGAHAQNTLISPLSVMMALAMTANGAEGETLSQMEAVLGMELGQLNEFSSEYLTHLSKELQIANSIWFREDARVTLGDSFGEANKNYYGADIYKRAFDQTTVDEINTWVEDRTNGMIKEALKEISAESVMYLINALAFEADWDVPYTEHNLQDDVFTTSWGSKQDIQLMFSEEDYYFEDEKMTGVMKPYLGREYAFVALMPNEGVSISEYAESLNGEYLHQLLLSPQEQKVHTWIPPFELEYEVEMSEILKKMGMELAFDTDYADFSKLGSSMEENIFINSVFHKTFIEVSLEGTKAGAVSIIEMANGAAMPEVELPKEVKLNRPFIYMIIDMDTKVPVFMGTLNFVES